MNNIKILKQRGNSHYWADQFVIRNNELQEKQLSPAFQNEMSKYEPISSENLEQIKILTASYISAIKKLANCKF